MIPRKKLGKILGKEVLYTATVSGVGRSGEYVSLQDVKYKGKLFADHIWTNNTVHIEKIEFGTRVGFLGTAVSYVSSGIRKYGIRQIHSYRILNDGSEISMNDSIEKLKREGKHNEAKL